MIINCDRCAVRGAACANCAVTFVTHPGERIELDAASVQALAALANAGMIPPLRYAPGPRDSATRRRPAPRARYAPPVAKAS